LKGIETDFLSPLLFGVVFCILYHRKTATKATEGGARLPLNFVTVTK
jgi:hypothetical protein